VRLAPAVRGYLRGQGARDPDDLLGEVFLRVAQSIHRFRGDEEDARRWVFTIAHHVLIDKHRRARVRPVESDAELPEMAATPAPSTAIDPELMAALGQLTEEQREVIVLRFVADLSLDDVARMTSRPVGAVKSMQARALARLGTLLEGAPV
jgi:RNA polymerase sigma-70 factor (ECF subfamily)